MYKYEIEVTKTYYATGNDAPEALDHLAEFYPIGPNDKIRFKLIEEEIK